MIGNKISIGTRGSQLAMWQANWIRRLIIEKNPNMLVELVIIKTKGDNILDVPLTEIGGKGLFIKEIEEALLDDKIDIAVHSMKDMPTDLPRGLYIGAIPEREDPRDALICREGLDLFKLSKAAKVGTGSLRRSAQLSCLRPDIEVVPIRGNLGTRLDKLETEGLDAVILAVAGLSRLGFKHRISQYLDVDMMLPAVGQGALCVETKENNYAIKRVLASVDNADTRCVVLAERALLIRLEGGCHIPIAANGVLDDGEIALTGLVSSVDGSVVIKKTLVGSADYPEQIGTELAELLLSFGAGDILRELL